MAEVATAHPLLLDNSRENSTEKRQKREEKEGAHHRKTSRGKEGSCASELTKRSVLLPLWPSGSGTGSCLLFTDTEPLVELF